MEKQRAIVKNACPSKGPFFVCMCASSVTRLHLALLLLNDRVHSGDGFMTLCIFKLEGCFLLLLHLGRTPQRLLLFSNLGLEMLDSIVAFRQLLTMVRERLLSASNGSGGLSRSLRLQLFHAFDRADELVKAELFL